LYFMVRFVIDLEAAPGDPEAVNIVLKTQRNQPTEVEETAARRLLPALCDLAKARFPDDEPGKPVAEETPSHH
jgi:hypothetical protein